MAVFIPIETWIEYGKISSYLAATAIANNKLFKGSDRVPTLADKIRLVYRSLSWKFNINPNDESLDDVALYLYALCGKYIIEAKRILGQGQAGQVVNPSTGTTVAITNPAIQFTVGNGGAPMNPGDTVLTLTYSNVVNPSIEVFLDGVDLPYGLSDRQSYTATYNDSNIVITFKQGVAVPEVYRVRFLQLINVGIPASLGNQTVVGGIFTGNL